MRRGLAVTFYYSFRRFRGHPESPCLRWDWHTASIPVVGSMDGTSKPTSVNRRPVHVRLERGNLIFCDTGSFTTWR